MKKKIERGLFQAYDKILSNRLWYRENNPLENGISEDKLKRLLFFCFLSFNENCTSVTSVLFLSGLIKTFHSRAPLRSKDRTKIQYISGTYITMAESVVGLRKLRYCLIQKKFLILFKIHLPLNSRESPKNSEYIFWKRTKV